MQTSRGQLVHFNVLALTPTAGGVIRVVASDASTGNSDTVEEVIPIKEVR